MGFLVDCPNCGPRSYHEFRFGGETRVCDDISKLWLRRNTAGEQEERWFHEAGCRRWSTHRRDTTTNAFLLAAGHGPPLPLDSLEGA
jgi:heterotetrameric sarcosine oxidase delta subunit